MGTPHPVGLPWVTAARLECHSGLAICAFDWFVTRPTVISDGKGGRLCSQGVRVGYGGSLSILPCPPRGSACLCAPAEIALRSAGFGEISEARHEGVVSQLHSLRAAGGHTVALFLPV